MDPCTNIYESLRIALWCEMCILVAITTVYNNGTGCSRLTAKSQAYKEREHFTLQRGIWQSFVPTELRPLDGNTMTRQAISAKRFSDVCHRVMCQVSTEANGRDKEKWTHAAPYDSLLPGPPEMGGTCAWLLLGSAKANIIWGNYAAKTQPVTQSHALTQRVGVINK